MLLFRYGFVMPGKPTLHLTQGPADGREDFRFGAEGAIDPDQFNRLSTRRLIIYLVAFRSRLNSGV